MERKGTPDGPVPTGPGAVRAMAGGRNMDLRRRAFSVWGTFLEPRIVVEPMFLFQVECVEFQRFLGLNFGLSSKTDISQNKVWPSA